MPPTLDAIPCGDLIPDRYRQPVQGAPLPQATVGSLSSALDAQTARLDQANGRTQDVIAIVAVCDTHNAAIKAALTPRRPWWRFW
jgi:hypothetical protein